MLVPPPRANAVTPVVTVVSSLGMPKAKLRVESVKLWEMTLPRRERTAALARPSESERKLRECMVNRT